MTSKQLFDQCSDILNGHYPLTMGAIDSQVEGPGFFPGTSGFLHSPSLSEDVRKPIMFVGQDFGTKAYLPHLRSNPNADVEVGTGLVLKKLLHEAGIDEADCFFTNALFGVRDSNNITGLCEGWQNKAYVAKCREAFELQIEAVQPRAIICLGCDAPRMLRLLFEPTKRWQQWTYAQIDREGYSVIDIVGHASVLAAGILVHPSFHHANVGRRRFRDLQGRQAEVALLKHVGEKALCA